MFLSVFISSSQGKQDLQNSSKIHYLSNNRDQLDINDWKSRSDYKQLLKKILRNKNGKESKKINIDINFVNNGRPYRINSKRSKMLTKLRRKEIPTAINNSTSIIKHRKNLKSNSEKTIKSSQNMKNVVGLNDKKETVSENDLKDNMVNKIDTNEKDQLIEKTRKELLEDINWVKDPARVTEEIPEAPISNRTNTNKSVIELHESVKDDKKMMKELTKNTIHETHNLPASTTTNLNDEIVPASTFKTNNWKVFPNINNQKNHLETHSSLPHWTKSPIIKTQHKLEKTHWTDINHIMTDQSSKLIPFPLNRQKIFSQNQPKIFGVPVANRVQNHQSSHKIQPVHTSPTSFLYRIVSPTSVHHHPYVSIPASTSLLSSYGGPYHLQSTNPHFLLYNHFSRPSVIKYPLYW